MEQSILVAADGSPPDEDATVAVAWQLVGPAAKAITIAAFAACIALTIAWSSQAPAAIATGLALGVTTAERSSTPWTIAFPNGLVAMAAVPVGVATAITAAAGSIDVAVGALAGAALLGVPLLITHLVSPVGMGFGDVKAGAVVGGAVGLVGAQLAVPHARPRPRRFRRMGGDPTAAHDPTRPGARRRRPACSRHRSLVRTGGAVTEVTQPPVGRPQARAHRPRGSGAPAARFEPGAPPSRDLATRWLVAGVLLVVLSALGGVLLFSSTDDRAEVVVAPPSSSRASPRANRPARRSRGRGRRHQHGDAEGRR